MPATDSRFAHLEESFVRTRRRSSHFQARPLDQRARGQACSERDAACSLRSRMTPLSRYVVETLVTLLAVVALSVLVLSVLRRIGVGKTGGPLELMARLPLEGRRAVYLVRAGETVYVLAASESSLAKLGEMPRDVLPPTAALEPRTFSAVLKHAIGVASAAAPRQVEASGDPSQERP